MAHYAEVDKNNVVVNVIVGRDEGEGVDWEKYYTDLVGYKTNTRFLRTSYNTYMGTHLNGGVPFRKNYAAIGYTYNEALDAFIPPKPYPSWIIDPQTGRWISPVPYPDETKIYTWDETTGSWVLNSN